MAGSFGNGAGLPDVSVLRQLSRDQLVLHLESVPGRKDLVLDRELMRPLDRIAGASLLKEHGVDKIFRLEPAKNMQGCDQRLYLVRPSIKLVQYIADQINNDQATNIKRTYTILFVPRKLHVCELLLEQEGVHGLVTIHEFQMDFIPLDRDILSLELPLFFRSFFLDGDHQWIHSAARALVGLQQVFGLIPNVYAMGRGATMVHELTEVMFEDQGEPKQLNAEIGHIFLIDRDVDYVTALCSQVTYEGLIDDIYKITSGFVEFGPEVTGREQSTKLLLSSQDVLFEDIRNRHFSNVFSYLSAKAKDLQSGYDRRHNMTSVREMKEFVANDLKDLKQQHKSLTLHIGACEFILKKKTKGGDFEEQLRTEHSLLEGVETKENVNYIEEMINRQMNTSVTLRLMCLLSLTQNGMTPQTYKFLKTQFLQSHGFEHMVTFHNLKKLGLLMEQENQTSGATKQLSKVAAIANIPRSSQFRALCKKLNLIPKSAEEVNLKNPSDMSYVYSGAYTPLSCKLVEQVLSREGFGGLDDVLKVVPGSHFSKIRAKSAKGKSGGGHSGGHGVSSDPSSRRVLVYFLGGCTYSEITALRLLGKLKGYNFVVATTNMINSTGLIDLVTDRV